MFFLRLFLLISLLIFIVVALTISSPNQLFTEAAELPQNTLTAPVVLATESKFTSEIIEQGQKIPFPIKTEYSPDKDACSDPEILQPGKEGKRIKEIQVTYYDGQEYNREVVAIRNEKPQEEIIIKGLKKSYQTIQTDSGTINYWCKLGTFTATAYDATCTGCDDRTAIGLKTGFGVVAVDKHVISLGSQLYITGYGKAIAGDTGGAINGKRIDLGFDNIGKWWGRREVEVYLL